MGWVGLGPNFSTCSGLGQVGSVSLLVELDQVTQNGPMDNSGSPTVRLVHSMSTCTHFIRGSCRVRDAVGALTKSSAIAEKPRDASCLSKYCQFPRNGAETVHSVQYRLSSYFKQFSWDIIRTCGFATCCLTRNFLLSSLLFNSMHMPSTAAVYPL